MSKKYLKKFCRRSNNANNKIDDRVLSWQCMWILLVNSKLYNIYKCMSNTKWTCKKLVQLNLRETYLFLLSACSLIRADQSSKLSKHCLFFSNLHHTFWTCYFKKNEASISGILITKDKDLGNLNITLFFFFFFSSEFSELDTVFFQFIEKLPQSPTSVVLVVEL